MATLRRKLKNKIKGVFMVNEIKFKYDDNQNLIILLENKIFFLIKDLYLSGRIPCYANDYKVQ